MRLECRNLSRRYEDGGAGVQALHEVSFELGKHEFVAIVGPSGCGKTTLLKLIAGLLEPTGGRVVFQDGGGSQRPSAAMVFQEHGLFPWMTVLDNVAFGLEALGAPRAERRRRAHELVERVGLDRFADKYPRQLSVGMRQRVGIVRAFATDPELLLMDEPFGALDSQTRLVLQDELLLLWRQRRCSVLFVTHDIGEAIRLADRILVLGGQPGTVLDELQVPLERPRDPDGAEHREIRELRQHIWRLLEGEVRDRLGLAR